MGNKGSAIAVITDSVSCIPREQAEYYKIGILPVHILFEGREYRNGLDLIRMMISKY